MLPKPFEVISMIPKRMKMIAAIFAVVLTSGVAFALPDASTVNDVRFTVHNFSNNTDPNKGLLPNGGRNYAAKATGNADQVCVFCHTPHNASPAVPLWNKAYPSGSSYADGFRLYTSSATLSPTAKAAKLTSNSESLLCLSCHDGKTAVNVLHNSSYRDSTAPGGDAVIDLAGGFTAGPFSIGQAFISGGTNLANLGAVRNSSGTISTLSDSMNGQNLTDDHPIGFSYTAAQGQDVAGLKTTPDAGIRLFGPTKRVECSSCHNPHVYYGAGLMGNDRVSFDAAFGWPVSDPQKERTPFLNVSNRGSKLCLGCHIK